MIDLEKYLIAEESSWFDKDEIITGLSVGAILLAPFTVTAIINKLREKRAERTEQIRANRELANRNAFNAKLAKELDTVLEINKRIPVEYPEVWANEKKEREKAIAFFKKQVKSLMTKNKSLPTGLEFGANDLSEKYNPNSCDYFEFLDTPIPEHYPRKGDYWDSYGWYFPSIITYDIWSWVEDHGNVNARDMDVCADYWKALEEMNKMAYEKMKSSPFFYGIMCGGDWDDGTYEIRLKPSDSLLKIACKMGAKPWPDVKNIY